MNPRRGSGEKSARERHYRRQVQIATMVGIVLAVIWIVATCLAWIEVKVHGGSGFYVVIPIAMLFGFSLFVIQIAYYEGDLP